uniref:Putative secreted protein n=1 Tax=Ixodes ricinus TaxID=34613 RepID=A0A6B0TZB5_IXORI
MSFHSFFFLLFFYLSASPSEHSGSFGMAPCTKNLCMGLVCRINLGQCLFVFRMHIVNELGPRISSELSWLLFGDCLCAINKL